MNEKSRVRMPPLRPYEFPDLPTTAVSGPAEKDAFCIPGEQATRDEELAMPRPVILPPLHPSELPDSVVQALNADADPVLDNPEWGTARKAPEIIPGHKKLLRPWDD
ncbi:MAG: hypothetical protein GYA23_06680 [Methanomicrobiales archaeon]|nr:hypothetical protein [Methanomicrobiales archaeon]